MSEMENALLPLTEEQISILARCGTDFCHAVEEKFNCKAILHNIEEAGSFAGNISGDFTPTKRYSTKLPGGVEVSVWKDDLTQHKVDAVVNAANEDLQHGGGLAHALCMAGGPEIQQWSNDVIKHNGRLKAGDAVVTPGGKLPCKLIIHAVGPRVSPNPAPWEIKSASPSLFQAINSILNTVCVEKIQSVAIPALSSGLFHFPRPDCADIIVSAVKKFCEFEPFRDRSFVTEIRLVNNDDPSVQEMERAARAMFDSPSISGSYSGAAKGSYQSKTSFLSDGVPINNIRLHLKKGAIEEEMADVLVNTISSACDLSMGLISKAILMKAGHEIQREIYRLKSGSLSFGSPIRFYETKGYRLNCKRVFHTVCAPKSEYKANEILYNVVLDCLKKAHPQKTISFPAIGTGNLGFSKVEVAKIMTDAVFDFAKRSPSKLDVYFVVFPADIDMMEAFENELKLRTRGASPDVRPSHQSDLKRKENSVEGTPLVEFVAVSNETLREAKQWTCNILKASESITIQNNHVIYFGQKEFKDLLSLQTMLDVRIEEFCKSGKSGLSLHGSPLGVGCAAIKVEAMLCRALKEFARAEEQDLLYSVVRWSCKDKPWVQTPEVSAILEKAFLAKMEKRVINSHEFSLKSMMLSDNSGLKCILKRTHLLDPINALNNNSFYQRTSLTKQQYVTAKLETKPIEKSGLQIVKVERLENVVLQKLFAKHVKRVNGSPSRLYQCVSAQFCDSICRLGFQRDFSPPQEQRYGSGIYFSQSVEGALKLWKDLDNEQYVYIIQAQVLTGNSVMGSQDLILPPPLKDDPLERHDSLCDKMYTYVIFNSLQALPEYLITCSRSSYV